jgi:purine-binding chemotaxis protein CheW
MAQCLIISVAGRRLSLSLEAVSEIIDRGAVTRLPQLPAAIPGVIDVRGAAVPLIDTGALAGGRSRLEGRSIVVVNDGVRPIALLIDEVEGIADEADVDEAFELDLSTLLEVIA